MAPWGSLGSVLCSQVRAVPRCRSASCLVQLSRKWNSEMVRKWDSHLTRKWDYQCWGAGVGVWVKLWAGGVWAIGQPNREIQGAVGQGKYPSGRRMSQGCTAAAMDSWEWCSPSGLVQLRPLHIPEATS